MVLLVWLVVGAIVGFIWSRRMANSGLPDIAAGAAGGLAGGLLTFVLKLSGGGTPNAFDVIGPLIVSVVGLLIWRVAIGRRV